MRSQSPTIFNATFLGHRFNSSLGVYWYTGSERNIALYPLAPGSGDSTTPISIPSLCTRPRAPLVSSNSSYILNPAPFPTCTTSRPLPLTYHYPGIPARAQVLAPRQPHLHLAYSLALIVSVLKPSTLTITQPAPPLSSLRSQSHPIPQIAPTTHGTPASRRLSPQQPR